MVAITRDAEGLRFERRTFNGKLALGFRLQGEPKVVTVQRGSTPAWEGGGTGSVEVTREHGANRYRCSADTCPGGPAVEITSLNLASLLIAFVFGALSFLSPCVLPLLPGFVYAVWRAISNLRFSPSPDPPG